MDSQQVFTFGQQSLYMLLMISAPILLTVLAVGLGEREHAGLSR